ncbi:MAG: hypothetical protein AAGA29_03645 [Planctomycetota bacterium]
MGQISYFDPRGPLTAESPFVGRQAGFSHGFAPISADSHQSRIDLGVTLAQRYRTDPRRIRRRIARIADRMQSAEFRFTLLHEKQLTPKLRKTARLLFLQGRSLRHTAKATNSTLHRVRTDRATLQTLARAAA